VAASVLGSALQPRLKWIGAAIGAGLVAAAISDTCVLGTALAKMPWNRPAADFDVNAVLHALSSNA
jgi:hypothetical protein